ncbi:MAG: hypothetical protein KGZ94_10390 [Clostridia bacterium]|nr:hypothetical protein [Clostridia bacterium]
MRMPTVEVGEPQKNKDNYTLMNIGEIMLYISPSLVPVKNEINISLKGFLFMKDFDVKGFKCE